MTQEIATRLAAIFATADGGCSYCAVQLADEAARTWPEFGWVAMTRAALDAS